MNKALEKRLESIEKAVEAAKVENSMERQAAKAFVAELSEGEKVVWLDFATDAIYNLLTCTLDID